VESAAIATSVPLDIHGLGIRPFTLEGRARGDGTAGESLGMVGAGALAGWLVAFVTGLDVFGASMDVSIFLGVPTVLLLVAGFACWLPVERAIGADPMAALRQE
jgi:ABC-type lipoprotein release transport system permease subunit